MSIDYDRFRRELESEQARLRHALAAVNHEGSLIEESGDLAIGSGDHLADSATDTFMRELDEGLGENAEHILGEIEEALRRIDVGTYGVCEKCGEKIPKERLRALPYASLCVKCKSGGLSRR